LVRGEVDISMLDAAYTEVRALTESNPRAAAAPISRETPGFVLALAGPGPFVVQFLGTNQAQPLLLALTLEAPYAIVPCAGTSLIDLGVIRFSQSACGDSAACTQAQGELMMCQTLEQASCDQLAADIEACHSRLQAACGPLQVLLDECTGTGPGMDCSEQQRQVDACRSTNDCSTSEQTYLARCLSVCRAQRERVGMECAATPPCMPPPGFAFPDNLAPAKCGVDGPPQAQGGG